MILAEANAGNKGQSVLRLIPIGVAIFLMLVALLAYFYLSRSAEMVLTSSKNESTLAWTSLESSSPQGLYLTIALNSTVVRFGQSIRASASDNNTLPYFLEFAPDQSRFDNLSSWIPYSESACGSVLPMAMGMFQGHLTTTNISKAGLPLHVIPFTAGGCPVNANITRVVFLPTSTSARLYYSQYGQPPDQLFGEFKMTVVLGCTVRAPGDTCQGNTGVSGYYTGSSTFYNSTSVFHPLERGEYTLVAGDYWGQLAFAYFRVI